MKSKEYLKQIATTEVIDCTYNDKAKKRIANIFPVGISAIEKDLEILECFKKIDKKDIKDFIETQIRYTLNENTWLSACNCDLEKEKPTKHLIKIKEWLENE